MTLETLQTEMISALKSGDKLRKGVLSELVGAVKKAAIDKGCRDNVTEAFTNEVLLKEQKTMQEMIDTCPADRAETLAEYKAKMGIISEFAPKLLTDPETIKQEITSLVTEYQLELTKKNKGAIMKIVAPAMKGRVDMKIVNQILSECLR